MMNNTRKSLKLYLVVLFFDWITLNLSILFLHLLGWFPIGYETMKEFVTEWVAANVAYGCAVSLIKLSLHKRMTAPYQVIKNTTYTAIVYAVFLAAFLGFLHYFVPGPFRSMAIAGLFWAFAITERLSARKLLANYRTRGGNVSYVVFVGYDRNVRKIVHDMKDSWTGYIVRGLFSDGTEYRDELPEVPFLGTNDKAYNYLQHTDIDEIYICLPDSYDASLQPVIHHCEQNRVKIYYVPQSHSSGDDRMTVPVKFGDTYVLALYNEPLQSLGSRLVKRTFDIVFSSLFLFTLFPIIYLIVAIVTKITMPGPVFFKQTRTGYDGKDFTMIKFRSMKVNDDADTKQATKDDERVTKWGKFLRHSSIDELPQFINVFRGDMSVVGPRPHMLAHTEYYSQHISDYMIRHYVKPGITGWAQTHGERGETKEVEDMARRVEKDIWYVEHWSLSLDLHIIVKTIRDAIVGDSKAY